MARTRKRARVIMQPDTDSESAGAEMHRSIMTAFCDVLRTTRLPPMAVMSLAASALGTVYKEVADQHRSDGACPCGWKPNLPGDVEALQAALAATTKAIPPADLRVMQAVGRA
jgi:hypothetical protein